MNTLLKHFVVLFTLLVLSGYNAYPRIPASSPVSKNHKQCLIKEQCAAFVTAGDIEDDSEDDLKNADHAAIIIFSCTEINFTEKGFFPAIPFPRKAGIKKNILHAVFRI